MAYVDASGYIVENTGVSAGGDDVSAIDLVTAGSATCCPGRHVRPVLRFERRKTLYASRCSTRFGVLRPASVARTVRSAGRGLHLGSPSPTRDAVSDVAAERPHELKAHRRAQVAERLPPSVGTRARGVGSSQTRPAPLDPRPMPEPQAALR